MRYLGREQFSNRLKIIMVRGKQKNLGCPNVRHKKLKKLSRNSIIKVIGFLTGHCLLRRCLSVIGVKNYQAYKGFSCSEEMTVHILCECGIYSAYKFKHLGWHLIEP